MGTMIQLLLHQMLLLLLRLLLLPCLAVVSFTFV